MRTIEEIYNELIELKERRPELQGLTSTSKTAIWRLLLWLFAVALWMQEWVFEKNIQEIKSIASKAFAGTIAWYYNISMAFQLGDDLKVFDDGRVDYETIDPTKQIIKRCAVVEKENVLIIKVAKETNGEPQPLSEEEEIAFSNYIKKRKFAGTRINIINHPPDELQVRLTVYYNPLVLKPNGSYQMGLIIYPAKDAVKNYIKNIKFGGKLVKTHLVDEIQKALGVCDVTLHYVKAKKYADTQFNLITENFYEAYSGYFKITDNNIIIDYKPCNVS